MVIFPKIIIFGLKESIHSIIENQNKPKNDFLKTIEKNRIKQNRGIGEAARYANGLT